MTPAGGRWTPRMRGLALPFIDGENILSAKSLLLSDELHDNAAFESLFSFVKKPAIFIDSESLPSLSMALRLTSLSFL
jgi:hypothetical protein